MKLLPSREAGEALPFNEFTERMKFVEDASASRNEFPVRVEIKPDALKTWCERNNIAVSQLAVSRYATARMVERISANTN